MGVGLPPRYPGHIADGTVWDINSTCAEFGPKCLHILEIQHQDTELANSRLSTAIGERDDTCDQVMEAEQPSAASRGGKQGRQTLAACK